MQPNWAAENLQVIRTLMERSAIYRRALAPIMLLLGLLGTAAAVLGWQLRFESGRMFVAFWIGTSLVGSAGAFFLVRRQALKAAEPLWSPPTRRVTQAVLPGLAAGCAGAVLVLAGPAQNSPAAAWLPPLWMALYGCALHAAGFFMQRGIKLFGWLFIASAAAWSTHFSTGASAPTLAGANAAMGAAFGGLHLAYGAYLYFSESRKNEA